MKAAFGEKQVRPWTIHTGGVNNDEQFIENGITSFWLDPPQSGARWNLYVTAAGEEYVSDDIGEYDMVNSLYQKFLAEQAASDQASDVAAYVQIR